jgi:hypothetical protein
VLRVGLRGHRSSLSVCVSLACMRTLDWIGWAGGGYRMTSHPHIFSTIHPSISLVDQQRRFDLFPFLGISSLGRVLDSEHFLHIRGVEERSNILKSMGVFNGWIDGVGVHYRHYIGLGFSWSFLYSRLESVRGASILSDAYIDAYIDGRTNSWHLAQYSATPKITSNQITSNHHFLLNMRSPLGAG